MVRENQAAASERSLQLRIAIMAGLFGLFGTLVGGLSTYLVTSHSESTTESANRRIERRDAYSKLYGDAAAYSVGVKSYLDANSDDTRATALRKFDDQAQALFLDQAAVVLLGARNVRDAGFVLGTQIATLQSVVQEKPLNKSQVLAETAKTAQALDDFSAAATADLEQ